MNNNKKYANVSLMVQDVLPCWGELIYGGDMRQFFINAIKKIDPDDISPIECDVFNFAKFKKLSEINVVILNENPYDSNYNNNGLCFSSLSKKIPNPVKNLYSSLEKYKLIKSADDIKTANLISWAQQGVLMLNCALTISKNNSVSHMELWKPITDNIIKKLGAINDRPVIFLLWGNYACSMKNLITSDTAIVLENCHPDNDNFILRDHFTMANKILEEENIEKINWDPSFLPKHEAFTDGSGHNTKNINSKASYACCFTKGPSKGTMLYGRLSPVSLLDLNEIKSDDKWDPQNNPCWIDDKRKYTINGIHSKTKTWEGPLSLIYIAGATNEIIFPNSQRGEGAGILSAFEYVIRLGRSAILEVVTDSMFWINMLDNYIPNWVKSKNPFISQKNPDIVSRLWSAVGEMSKLGIIWSTRHIKSHGKDSNADPRDVRLNDIVDKKAFKTRDGNEFGDFITRCDVN